jgi:hypothetical protein
MPLRRIGSAEGEDAHLRTKMLQRGKPEDSGFSIARKRARFELQVNIR